MRLALMLALLLEAVGSPIDRVHIVWMNHLDVGFTNNIASVVNQYFHEYFPKAIATAAAVNKPGQPPVFKYTSHAWLLDMFLDCPRHVGLACPRSPPPLPGRGVGVTPDYDPGCLVCPNASLVAAVEAGIKDDVITWHAFPFNAEPELADAGLLLGGIDSVHALDARFGKAKKTVISQRDVPGVTRGIVPLMAQRGIKAFSEGCNAQIQPPDTPPIFTWKDEASSSSVIMMLHQRGYGVEVTGGDSEHDGTPATATATATRRRTEEEQPPQMCAGLMGRGESLRDVVQVDGFNEALMYAFISDNQGPPTPEQVHATLDCITNASGGVGLFPGTPSGGVSETTGSYHIYV
eukprot:COSAG05_NODE_63_length_22889_cov_41.986617_6_plen_349_part_00